MTKTLTFKQFNDEINEFHKHLKDNKFTDDEIRKIFAPLNRKNTKLILLIPIFIVSVLYLATYSETISWHFSALGRIILIKLLPFWDWTPLKNEKCLISRTIPQPEITFNCNLCENIDEIDVYNDISPDLLKNRYLDLDVPVIVKSKLQNWPTSIDFIDDLLTNEDFANSKPCNLATNVYNGLTTIRRILSQIAIFDKFFIHFQNCDFSVMKQFRSYTPRPPYLPPELSPVQYNWLLWNKNYNGSNFKPIGLVEKITLMRQITGGNLIRLLPRNNCELECPQIDVKLTQGESLIFTNLWDLEYKPGDGENVAVILEMH